ncbi:TPA: hypothetical protein ACH9QN_005382, partial [Escherichia coli]
QQNLASGLASRIETATDTRRERVFLLSNARAHLNYGGLCGGGEIRAGRFPGYANPAQFTTRRLASSVVSYLETTRGRHYDNSNLC